MGRACRGRTLLARMKAAWLAIIASTSLLAACATSQRPEPVDPDAPAPTETVRGDWSDVDASVEVACMRAQVALLMSTPSMLPDRRRVIRYRLLASDDRQYLLIATQGKAIAGVDASGLIDLVARGTPDRDLRVERILVRETARRLEHLAGREWAPIR